MASSSVTLEAPIRRVVEGERLGAYIYSEPKGTGKTSQLQLALLASARKGEGVYLTTEGALLDSLKGDKDKVRIEAYARVGVLAIDECAARVSGNVFAGRNRYGDWYAMYRGHQISSGHTNASRAISKGLEALGDVKDPRTRMKRAAELVSNVTLGRSSQGRAQPRRFGSPPPGFIDITGAR